jgi:chromosome segregation ATPase
VTYDGPVAALCHRLERERDDLRERYESALEERDSWRMRAEEKWAMRRELEELLGVNHAAASDEQFQKGLNRLKEIIRERDEANYFLNELAEVDGQLKFRINELCEVLRKTEKERDEAREIIRKAKVKFCEDGPDGKIAAEMFAILGSLEREYK